MGIIYDYGDDVMNFKRHYILNSIVLIPTGIILFYYLWMFALLPMIAGGIVLGAKVPDLDLTSKKWKHRNIFFHSLFFPVIFMILSWMEPVLILLWAIYGVGTGTHLLGDIRFKKEARVGYYCIKYPWFSVRTMSGSNSTRWLIGNFTASVVVLGLVAGWLL
jgi:hypothetical protein